MNSLGCLPTVFRDTFFATGWAQAANNAGLRFGTGSSTHLSATDPPLSRRMMRASYLVQNCMASNAHNVHPQIKFVSCCGLINRSAMVHKRPPVAGDSPAATASERLRVANINRQIAEELGVREQQVEATVALLDGGATVPFVARYRKEITGALDDAQLRTLEERLNYLRELEERRITILNSAREQGKLDAALEAAILAADSKGRLEDIYLPFKPKRRT